MKRLPAWLAGSARLWTRLRPRLSEGDEIALALIGAGAFGALLWVVHWGWNDWSPMAQGVFGSG